MCLLLLIIWWIVGKRYFPTAWVKWMRIFDDMKETRNSVTFTDQLVLHDGYQFPLLDVTRFETGGYAELTGSRENNMKGMSVIRMWVDDASAIDIAQNKWQSQVNHAVRTALSRSLQTMQKRVADGEKPDQGGQVLDY